jgi:hypothetical protein
MSKKNKNWQHSTMKSPEIGERVLVKMLFDDNIYFAVCTGEDEYDVHRPDKEANHRECWFKYSHRTVSLWRYF